MDSDKLQIIDPKSTYIDEQAEIGEGTVVYPNTTILGKVKIGKNCEIGPNSIIHDSQISDNCVVFASVIKNSQMDENSDIGPFSHLRGNVKIGKNVHVGNYVEMVRSTVGSQSKIGHQAYLGDTTVGERVNIGSGTLTANFDGVSKHQTIIEDEVFIGANTVLVAPVKVGRGAKTGAGAVVKQDVPEKTLVAGVPAEVKKKLS